MSIEGIDYSDARPGGAAIRAAGKSFVMRYVEYPAAGGKGLKPDEKEDLLANGLNIGMVFESDGLTPLQGATAGDFDAKQAVTGLALISWPADRPCYFACDTDAQPSQYPAIDAYLIAAGKVLGGGAERVGIYGSKDLVDHCLTVGSAKWGWQTYAWSHGQVSALAHVLQYSNGEWGDTVDFCRSLKDDFGQWPKPEVDEVSQQEYEDLLLAVYSGSEEANLDRATRLVNAKWRRDQAASAQASSVADLAASARAIVQQKLGA